MDSEIWNSVRRDTLFSCRVKSRLAAANVASTKIHPGCCTSSLQPLIRGLETTDYSLYSFQGVFGFDY